MRAIQVPPPAADIVGMNATAQLDVPPPPARPDPETPRILLVEDSEDDALLLQHELRATVGPASYERVDDEAGLRAALASGPWDLVICDHWMPGFDSELALGIVKAQAPGTPLVIFSGTLDPERAVAAMQAGAHDFIDKHDRARLVPVVLRELNGARVQRDKFAAQATVIELSHFDTLTRLPNRESFTERLQADLSAPRRGENPALFVFDIDRFHRVNESHGFEAGDAAIRAAGAALAAIAGERTAAARLGPNKFAIYLAANNGERTAMAFARNLARRFAEGFRLPGGTEVHFTLSAGISLATGGSSDAGALLRDAESAAHVAKANGGNAILVYDPAMNAMAARKLTLENALHVAVGRSELQLAYQPVVFLASGRVVGAEALLRWDHAVLGPIGPGEFVGLAEESGLIGVLGQWALDKALADARSIRERGHSDFRISVNVSAAQFRDTSLAESVHLALGRAGVPPEALELEITESLALDESDNTAEALASLRRAGVRIAIDDFGTGFASLAYLKRLPFDTLKIDRGFVSGLPDSREDCAIVSALAALATGLDCTLHAEGVETEAQRDWLLRAGCHRAQGYLLGRPASAASLIARL